MANNPISIKSLGFIFLIKMDKITKYLINKFQIRKNKMVKILELLIEIYKIEK